MQLSQKFVIAMGPLTCWIAVVKDVPVADGIIFYMSYRGLPILVGLIIVILAYKKAITSLKDVPKCYFQNENFSVYQLLWYPAIFFITYIPYVILDSTAGLINRSFIMILALIFSHPIGFYNALLFIIQRRLYKGNKKEEEETGNFEIESETANCNAYEDDDNRYSLVSNY